MSESKHYPGPWVDSPEASDAIIAPNAGDDPNGIKYYGGALVAETVAPCNKPLIQAAPDLLQVLERALEHSNCPGDNCAIDWHAQARVVIAKAKGDQS